MKRALRALAVLVVLVTGLGVSSVLAQTSIPNNVWVELAQETWHHADANVDAITNDPLAWEPMWSAGLANMADDSKAALNGVGIAVDTNMNVRGVGEEGVGDPQTSLNGDGSTHFAWSLENPVDENIGAGVHFFGSNGPPLLERPGFTASRRVTPEILVDPVTDQVATVTVRFTEPLPPDATMVQIQIGVDNQYGVEFPLASGSVLGQKAVDGWDSSASGYQAFWWTPRQNIKLGKPYEFQATLRSVRNVKLTGTPVFVPAVLIGYTNNSGAPLASVESDSATITLSPDSTHWMKATWSATPDGQYPLTWVRVLSSYQRTLHMMYRLSEVVTDGDGNGTVSVPATSVVRVPGVDPNSYGVLMVSTTLPDGYRDLKGVSVASAEANGTQAKHASISGNRIILTFDRQALIAGATGDKVSLTISGRLSDGTIFSSQADVTLTQPAS